MPVVQHSADVCQHDIMKLLHRALFHLFNQCNTLTGHLDGIACNACTVTFHNGKGLTSSILEFRA